MSKVTQHIHTHSLSIGSSESDDDFAIQGIMRLSVLSPPEGPRKYALAYATH